MRRSIGMISSVRYGNPGTWRFQAYTVTRAD